MSAVFQCHQTHLAWLTTQNAQKTKNTTSIPWGPKNPLFLEFPMFPLFFVTGIFYLFFLLSVIFFFFFPNFSHPLSRFLAFAQDANVNFTFRGRFQATHSGWEVPFLWGFEIRVREVRLLT